MRDDLFADIIEALKEVATYAETGTVPPGARLHHVPNVREIRRQLGHTQASFAHLLEVSLPTLRSWEHGKAFPNAAAVEQLKALLPPPKPSNSA